MNWLPASWPKRISLFLLAAFFTYAGVGHFTNEAFFLAIVPPWLPYPLLMVQISGVAEIAGGVGILIPQLRRLAGWGLLALLVAVYPANIHMALASRAVPGDDAERALFPAVAAVGGVRLGVVGDEAGRAERSLNAARLRAGRCCYARRRRVPASARPAMPSSPSRRGSGTTSPLPVPESPSKPRSSDSRL